MSIQYSLGGGHTQYLFSDKANYNFIILMLFLMVLVGLASVASLVWGLTTLIGLMFIALAFLMVLTRVQPYIFLLCIVLGVLFFFMGYVGVEGAIVDLSVIPGLESLHNWVHGI